MVGAERAKVSGKEVREVMGRLGEASGFCSDDTGNEGRVWAGGAMVPPRFQGSRLGNNAFPPPAGWNRLWKAAPPVPVLSFTAGAMTRWPRSS